MNSKNDLILSDEIGAIEADVVIGTLTTSDCENDIQIPVMGHPPATSSDLSLEQFLKTIKEHNVKHPTFAKIVKLDFKSIEVVTESVNMLEKDWKQEYVSEILSAEIPSRKFQKYFPITDGHSRLDQCRYNG